VISDTIALGEEVAHSGIAFRPHTTTFGRPGRGALRPFHGFGRLPVDVLPGAFLLSRRRFVAVRASRPATPRTSASRAASLSEPSP
jgi:hypothetical protein